MKWPLLIQVWFTLRRAVKALHPEARAAVPAFVLSQKRANGYCGAGGQVEPYYTQFGVLLENVFSSSLLHAARNLVPLAGKGFHVMCQKDDVYSLFFGFLNREMRMNRPCSREVEAVLQPFRHTAGGYVHALGRPEPGTNATCAALAMLHQTGTNDKASLQWLLDRQDETGGFRASSDAPMPDLLSTGVAMFALHLCGVKPRVPVADFVDSHWLANGGFAPTLLDDYSDVEYVFYGLLALGSV